MKPYDSFSAACKAVGLPVPETSYRFHPTRKWEFDYAWPERQLAVEVEGGLYIQGRHSRGAGYEKDMEKYNAAVTLGWRILRYSPRRLLDGIPEILETWG